MDTTQPFFMCRGRIDLFLTVSSIDLLGNHEYEIKFGLPRCLFLGAFWNLRLKQSEENSKMKDK